MQNIATVTNTYFIYVSDANQT